MIDLHEAMSLAFDEIAKSIALTVSSVEKIMSVASAEVTNRDTRVNDEGPNRGLSFISRTVKVTFADDSVERYAFTFHRVVDPR